MPAVPTTAAIKLGYPPAGHDKKVETTTVTIIEMTKGDVVERRRHLNNLIELDGLGSPHSHSYGVDLGLGKGLCSYSDNGSTHNFVQAGVVERMQLPITDTKPFKGLDIVLGIQWLQKLGKVTHDYSQQTMEFMLVGRGYTLRGDEALRMKWISLHHMHRDHAICASGYRPTLGVVRVTLSVKKKDGSYRYLFDYRALNKVTVKDKFPIPTADEMFDELGGAIIFTKLDLRAGYHQIRFGLTNAPSTFQATMNQLFSPYLRKFVIVFFDDILIYSANLAAHLEHLHCVFQRLQDNHFYVKESKCVFGATTLEYLGHIISVHGVEMDPKKISAVVDWPIPTNQRQVRGFLGLAGYYRRFIKDYATIAAPLSSLLQKKGFRWGELEKQAFDDLKTRLSDAPVLVLLNFEEMFVVEANASTAGIGVVLMQKGHPLCYFSRKLRPRMRVAATYQKELFAIVEAVYKWRHYLLGRRFTIRTDHISLKELLHQVLHRRIDSNDVMEGFRHEQGLLLFHDRYYVGAESKLKELLLSEFHDRPMAGHSGVKKMLVGLSALFYWKRMR
ncbi:ty3-gypsy retrotransposon protein [Tanacetum coccineum]